MNPTAEHENEPPWLKLARAEMAAGVEEIEGPEAHPRILAYFEMFNQHPLQGDETPWCSMGACAVLEMAGIQSPRSPMARSFLRWGIALKKPRHGSLCVLSRGSNPLHGHVGFRIGQTFSRVLLLGGNQGNKWSIATYPKWRVIGDRWPVDASGRELFV